METPPEANSVPCLVTIICHSVPSSTWSRSSGNPNMLFRLSIKPSSCWVASSPRHCQCTAASALPRMAPVTRAHCSWVDSKWSATPLMKWYLRSESQMHGTTQAWWWHSTSATRRRSWTTDEYASYRTSRPYNLFTEILTRGAAGWTSPENKSQWGASRSYPVRRSAQLMRK